MKQVPQETLNGTAMIRVAPAVAQARDEGIGSRSYSRGAATSARTARRVAISVPSPENGLDAAARNVALATFTLLVVHLPGARRADPDRTCPPAPCGCSRVGAGSASAVCRSKASRPEVVVWKWRTCAHCADKGFGFGHRAEFAYSFGRSSRTLRNIADSDGFQNSAGGGEASAPRVSRAAHDGGRRGRRWRVPRLNCTV